MILYQQKANGLKQKALASDYSDQHQGLLFNLKSPVRIVGMWPMIGYYSFDFERKEVNETELTPLFSCSNLAFRSPEEQPVMWKTFQGYSRSEEKIIIYPSTLGEEGRTKVGAQQIWLDKSGIWVERNWPFKCTLFIIFLPKRSQILFVVKELNDKIFQKQGKYKMIFVNYAPSFQYLIWWQGRMSLNTGGKYLEKHRTMKNKALSGGDITTQFSSLLDSDSPREKTDESATKN